MSKENKRSGKHSEGKSKPADQQPAVAPPTPEEVNTVRKDSHINFWVPEGLMERLKIHAAKSKKTIKQIGIEALEQFLSENT